MTTEEPTWARRTRRILMYALALITGSVGLTAFFTWFFHDLTPGLLPNSWVDWAHDAAPALLGLRITHMLLGFLLLSAYGWYGYAWYQGYIGSPFVVKGRSATAAFYTWFFLAFFSRNRLYRPRFRDSLEYPKMEAATAIVIAGTTALLSLLPLAAIKEPALGLHRINALYFFFLGFYSILTFALRRRGPSPWPRAPSTAEAIRNDVAPATPPQEGRPLTGGRASPAATEKRRY